MGNYYLNTGKFKPAIASYQTALTKEPQAVMALVNASLAYSRTGENRKAEESLRKAIKIAPESGAAHFNLGLLKAEQKDPNRRSITSGPPSKPTRRWPRRPTTSASCFLRTARTKPSASAGKASELRPDDPRYAFTLAFYLHKKGENQQAVKVLDALLEKHPNYRDAQMLKREITGFQTRPNIK